MRHFANSTWASRTEHEIVVTKNKRNRAWPKNQHVLFLFFFFRVTLPRWYHERACEDCVHSDMYLAAPPCTTIFYPMRWMKGLPLQHWLAQIHQTPTCIRGFPLEKGRVLVVVRQYSWGAMSLDNLIRREIKEIWREANVIFKEHIPSRTLTHYNARVYYDKADFLSNRHHHLVSYVA